MIMKIKLEEQVLDGFVKKCRIEMLSRLEVSRSQKRKAWFIKVASALIDYEESMKKSFIKVVMKDFSGVVSVKISGGQIDDEEVEKLKQFKEMIQDSDHNAYKTRLENQVLAAMSDAHGSKSDEEKDAFKQVIDDCHKNLLISIDEYILERLFEDLKTCTVEKSKLGAAIYNFTEKDIPDDIKELFKNGVESVPSVGLSLNEVKTRVNDAMLSYLNTFRSKYSWLFIDETDVSRWLEEAIKKEGNTENLDFYKRVQNGFQGMIQEVCLLYGDGKGNPMTEKVLKKKLEIENCIIVQCDKNLGMSMFTLETMRNADKELMTQLGATSVDKTKDEIFEMVFEEIDLFEESLDDDQKEYINYTYNDRDVRRCEITFPFLRSTHKVQKMSQDEIDNKDTSRLKFRPVIDSKRWMTRGYAELVMKMMRKLCQEMLEKAGPIMGGLKVKNGWLFASEMKDFEFEETFASMMSADIQEAYTNVTEKMINNSIETVCIYLGYNDWKKRLMQKLVTLVLGNNYVESSTGVYLFKMVLPMGYKLSGECLDVVGIASEMTKLLKLGEENEQYFGLKIGEVTDYPKEFGENDVERETSMARGVKQYKRYVDDSYASISGGTVEDVIDGILAIGFMYPAGLVINLDLNIWRAEFLDVFCWRSLANTTVSTMMKRNFKVPFGHVKKKSDHPERFKLKSLLGELLRNRRIASDCKIVEVMDSCILADFISIGYSKRNVQEEIQSCLEKVERNYSSEFVKFERTREDRPQYGGSIIYNGHYKYNEILENFIKNTKPLKAPKIMSKPGRKLKNIAFTKKRYLTRQQEDIDEQNIKIVRK